MQNMRNIKSGIRIYISSIRRNHAHPNCASKLVWKKISKGGTWLGRWITRAALLTAQLKASSGPIARSSDTLYGSSAITSSTSNNLPLDNEIPGVTLKAQSRRLTKRLLCFVNLTFISVRFNHKGWVQVKLERREIKLPKPTLEYHKAVNEPGRNCYQFVKGCFMKNPPGWIHIFNIDHFNFGKLSQVCYHS